MLKTKVGGKGRRTINVPKRGIYALLLAVLIVGLCSQVAVSFAAQVSQGPPIIGPTKFDRLKTIYRQNNIGSFERYGYYAEDWVGDKGSLNSVQSYGEHMSAVVPFAYLVDRQGNLSGNISDTLLQTARQKNLQVFALIHNYNQNGFDRNLVSSVLKDPNARRNLVNSIHAVLKEKKLAGVNVDLENVKGTDRQKFNLFLSELKEKLQQDNFLLTISVPAKTWDDPNNAWSGGFDYKRIGEVADRVMLMTYDEHWLSGPAGPVASVPWVDKVLKYAVSQIPREKLLLGIGAYGYDWSSGGKTKVVMSKNALGLAGQYGAPVLWDENNQVPYFYYWPTSQKHTVWFESTQSAAIKAYMVKEYGIRGIAVWRLGFEDKYFWEKMTQILSK